MPLQRDAILSLWLSIQKYANVCTLRVQINVMHGFLLTMLLQLPVCVMASLNVEFFTLHIPQRALKCSQPPFMPQDAIVYGFPALLAIQ